METDASGQDSSAAWTAEKETGVVVESKGNKEAAGFSYLAGWRLSAMTLGYVGAHPSTPGDQILRRDPPD